MCVCFFERKNYVILATIFLGEMSEWFKEHAWKVCVLQKGTAGSNPALSADERKQLINTTLTKS